MSGEDTRDTNWMNRKFTEGYHGQGNHEPAPPTPVHKLAEHTINPVLIELLEAWNTKQQECKDAYYREGRHSWHNTRRYV